jgi:hypothetical protein
MKIDINNISERTLYETYYYLISELHVNIDNVRKLNIKLFDKQPSYGKHGVTVYDNGKANYAWLASLVKSNLDPIDTDTITYKCIMKYCDNNFVIKYNYHPPTLYHYALQDAYTLYLILGMTNIKALYSKLGIKNFSDTLSNISDQEYWFHNYKSYLNLIQHRIINVKTVNFKISSHLLDMLTDLEIIKLFNFILSYAPTIIKNRHQMIEFLREMISIFDLDKTSYRFGSCSDNNKGSEYEIIKGDLINYQCYTVKDITYSLDTMTEDDKREIYTLLRVFGLTELYDRNDNYIFPIIVNYTVYTKYRTLYNKIDMLIAV